MVTQLLPSPFHVDGAAVQVSLTASPAVSIASTARELSDWLCPQCRFNNFARRTHCHRCGTAAPDPTKPGSVDSAMNSSAASAPSASLMFHGVPPHSTLDSFRAALNLRTDLPPAVDLRLPRDHVTGLARGFAFVDFSSVEAGTAAYTLLSLLPLHVDGSDLTHDFADPARYPPARGRVVQAPLAPTEQEPAPTKTASETGGWTLDPVSGYYFDAQSGYYWEPAVSLFFQWDDQGQKRYFRFDQSLGVYVPVTSEYTPNSNIPAATPAAESAPQPAPQPAPKKRVVTTVVVAAAPAVAAPPPAPPPASDPTPAAPSQSLSSAPPSASINETEEPITRGLVCLVCERQFADAEKLQRHCAQSELHRTNLALKRPRATEEVGGADAKQARIEPEQPQSAHPEAPPRPTYPVFTSAMYQDPAAGVWTNTTYKDSVKLRFRQRWESMQ